MKKTFISFLIITLTLVNISFVNIPSVQAAATDSTADSASNADNEEDMIKVSLENIREIMIENNLEIKILNNDKKIANEQYENAKDAYSDAKDAVEDFTLVVDEETGESNANELKTLKTARDNAESKVDSAKDNLKTAKSKYEQGVETKVFSAQQQYITYISDLAEQKISEDTAKSVEKDLNVAKIKYDSGFISKNEYITATQSNTTSTNGLKKTKDQIELDRIKLCNTLGLNPKEKIQFETEIIEDFKVISQINFNNDLNEMLENNIDIKLQKDTVEDAEDAEDDNDTDNEEDIYEYKVKNAELELKNLTKTTETDFRSQYNNLMSSYNTIKSSYDKIIQEQNVYKTTQIKYDYGFTSKKEVDAAKLAFDKDKTAFEADRNTLYINYLRYIQMKEGY